ncbi:MAG: Nramp family divalent metal transporter [Candidatus Hydrogenedentes bacterium]|nr:Nramp family divalent metal transporter [Candidatus Hydrogenedentota bacterium]
MSQAEAGKNEDRRIEVPAAPRGFMLLLALGPGLVWCGEYIGSGEVILSTRVGALFGTALLWVPVLAIFAKYWIGLAGAHYTVTTGEGMIDMMSRMPGPRNWVIWPVFIGQVSAGAFSTGALASVAGVFAAYFIPLPPFILGWIAVLLVISLVWWGKYDPLKHVMSVLVLLIIVGTLTVAYATWPGLRAIFDGVAGFRIPEPPAWAATTDRPTSPWLEIMPLLGWAAGGFASQVWYTYWVMGAGYGMTRGRDYGQPLDPAVLLAVDSADAQRLRGWRRVVTVDATTAVLIGITVTAAFMIAGAGVLGPLHIAPEGPDVAMTLSRIFGERWGIWGAHLFVMAGLAAMLSTMLGQFAGWPRLLSDCARLLIPGVGRWPWKTQFRSVLILYAASNMIIVYTLGLKPVFLVQLSAILDGLLLTPLQALAVGWVLYAVMPRFFSPEVRPSIRAHPVLALGLALAFVVFGYVCLFQLGQAF